jgi:hypothetical protein
MAVGQVAHPSKDMVEGAVTKCNNKKKVFNYFFVSHTSLFQTYDAQPTFL